MSRPRRCSYDAPSELDDPIVEPRDVSPDDYEPTNEQIGTERRANVYAARYAAGLPLWHPLDTGGNLQ